MIRLANYAEAVQASSRHAFAGTHPMTFTRQPFYVIVEKEYEAAQARAARAHRWRMIVLALFVLACMLAPLAAQGEA